MRATTSGSSTTVPAQSSSRQKSSSRSTTSLATTGQPPCKKSDAEAMQRRASRRSLRRFCHVPHGDARRSSGCAFGRVLAVHDVSALMVVQPSQGAAPGPTALTGGWYPEPVPEHEADVVQSDHRHRPLAGSGSSRRAMRERIVPVPEPRLRDDSSPRSTQFRDDSSANPDTIRSL
jgi:hypothetical protein